MSKKMPTPNPSDCLLPIGSTVASPVIEGLWTTDDLANYLQVSPRLVQRMRSAGKLPEPIRVGRLPRWRADVIMGWVEQGGRS
jgi:predicted DNA-binding transcriptional regulator AlpA